MTTKRVEREATGLLRAVRPNEKVRVFEAVSKEAEGLFCERQPSATSRCGAVQVGTAAGAGGRGSGLGAGGLVGVTHCEDWITRGEVQVAQAVGPAPEHVAQEESQGMQAGADR